jgi:hypothetical protein
MEIWSENVIRTQINCLILRSLHDVHEMNEKGLTITICPRLNSRTARRTWIKSGMDVMPLGFTIQLVISNTNMADERTCEVGSTLAPLTTGSYNDIWLQIFGKYKTLGQKFFV